MSATVKMKSGLLLLTFLFATDQLSLLEHQYQHHNRTHDHQCVVCLHLHGDDVTITTENFLLPPLLNSCLTASSHDHPVMLKASRFQPARAPPQIS